MRYGKGVSAKKQQSGVKSARHGRYILPASSRARTPLHMRYCRQIATDYEGKAPLVLGVSAQKRSNVLGLLGTTWRLESASGAKYIARRRVILQ